jgi:hypothetical protein
VPAFPLFAQPARADAAPQEAAAAAGGKRKAEGEPEGEAEAEEAAAAEKKAVEPVSLGPKTFTSAEQCFRYFSNLLSTQTMHQDCNQARLRGRARAHRMRLCAPGF